LEILKVDNMSCVLQSSARVDLDWCAEAGLPNAEVMEFGIINGYIEAI
jgi:hypothetical protein